MTDIKYSNFALPHILIKGGEVKPSINYGYGTYSSVENALATITSELGSTAAIPFGLAIGIKSNNVLAEYYWNGTQFVEKSGGGNINVYQHGFGTATYDLENQEFNAVIPNFSIKQGCIFSFYVDTFRVGDTMIVNDENAYWIYLNGEKVSNMSVKCVVTFMYDGSNTHIISFAKLPTEDKAFMYWLSIKNSSNGSVTFATKKVEADAEITGYTVTPNSGYKLLHWEYNSAEGETIEYSSSLPPKMPYHDTKLSPVFGKVGNKQIYINIPNHVTHISVMSEETDIDDTLTSSGYVEAYTNSDKITEFKIWVDEGYECTYVYNGTYYLTVKYNGVDKCYEIDDLDSVSLYERQVLTPIVAKESSVFISYDLTNEQECNNFLSAYLGSNDSSVWSYVNNELRGDGSEQRTVTGLASSKNLSHSSSSVLNLILKPNTTYRVTYSISCEQGYDDAYLDITGKSAVSLGSTSSASKHYEATNTIEFTTASDGKATFRYVKDGSASRGADSIWLTAINEV